MKQNKLKLMEELVLRNSCMWLDNKQVFSKWDDTINWIEGYPRWFQKYIRDLHKKAQQQEVKRQPRRRRIKR